MLGLSFCTAERQVLGKLESGPAGKMSSQLPNRNRDTMGGPSHLKLPQNSADSSSDRGILNRGGGWVHWKHPRLCDTDRKLGPAELQDCGLNAGFVQVRGLWCRLALKSR